MITIRIRVWCTVCSKEAFVMVRLYKPSGRIEWDEIRCEKCGGSEFTVLVPF